MDQNNILEFHIKMGVSFFIHFIGGIISVIIFAFFNQYQEAWLLIVSVCIFVLTSASFIYSYFWGWNHKIYVDANGFWYIKHKILYGLKWEEIGNIEVKPYFRINTGAQYLIIINSCDMSKKISFERVKWILQAIIEICPNQYKKKFKDVLSE